LLIIFKKEANTSFLILIIGTIIFFGLISKINIPYLKGFLLSKQKDDFENHIKNGCRYTKSILCKSKNAD